MNAMINKLAKFVLLASEAVEVFVESVFGCQ